MPLQAIASRQGKQHIVGGGAKRKPVIIWHMLCRAGKAAVDSGAYWFNGLFDELFYLDA